MNTEKIFVALQNIYHKRLKEPFDSIKIYNPFQSSDFIAESDLLLSCGNYSYNVSLTQMYTSQESTDKNPKKVKKLDNMSNLQREKYLTDISQINKDFKQNEILNKIIRNSEIKESKLYSSFSKKNILQSNQKFQLNESNNFKISVTQKNNEASLSAILSDFEEEDKENLEQNQSNYLQKKSHQNILYSEVENSIKFINLQQKTQCSNKNQKYQIVQQFFQDCCKKLFIQSIVFVSREYYVRKKQENQLENFKNLKKALFQVQIILKQNLDEKNSNRNINNFKFNQFLHLIQRSI